MKKQAGFTLLEIMLSLMIVGLIASVAGSAIVAGLNGYLAAKDNQSLAQKSQLAMLRVSRHLSEFVNIPDQSTNAKPDSIIIESLSPTSSNTIRTFAIGLDGLQLKIAEDDRGTSPDYHNGDVLVDGVSSFALTYYRDGATWQPAGDSLQRLATIQIDLVMVRPDGVTRSFVTQVHPRNINSLGGQPTPVTPPDQANYASCFVATAAYGRADHPMVLYLREFRDQYLMIWEGGKALVQAYYSVGPALASLIQGKPWACGLAQFLLLPFVIFSVFALYFPLGIPIVLFALWVLYRKSRRNPLCRKGVPDMLRDQKGAVLVAVVITMIIFATLGAMMLSFFTTSTFSQLGGSKGMRTFYLAESGLRYAASQYINAANEAARETVLEGMHNDTYSLAEGQFNLQVYPYWYQTTALPAGTNLQAKVFGGLPIEANEADKYANAWIQIKKPDGNVQYEQISSVTLNQPNGITFTKTGAWLESYPVGSTIYPVAMGVSSSQTFNANQAGSFISLQADSGYDIFLPRNGVFTVQEQGSTAMRTLGYDEVYVSGGYYQLRGIRDPNIAPGTTQAVTIPANSRIVLSKGIRLRSTGILSAGSAMETKRVVNYLLPLGYVGSAVNPKTRYQEKDWTNLAHWFSNVPISLGTQDVATLPGALHMATGRVTESYEGSGCDKYSMSQLGFNWSATGANFSNEWLRAGRYLSYDVQVKMFLLDNSGNTYSGGITFRLDENGNSYGLTIGSAIAGVTGCDDTDLIPDGVAGATNKRPMLWLWQNYDNTFKQLQYSELTPGSDNNFDWFNLLKSTSYPFEPPGGPYFWLRNWVTILIRLKEAPSIYFNNGGGTLHEEIKYGDTVYQTGADGTVNMAMVAWNPVYYASDTKGWDTGTAAGALILDVIPGQLFKGFDNGTLYVGTYPLGRALANVTDFKTKENWVRIYVADPNSVVAGNTYPTDTNRNPIARGSILWPPDDLSKTVSGNDYFTIVRFSDWNVGSNTGYYWSKENTDIDRWDVLCLKSTTFVTPSLGSSLADQRAEIGLHAFGSNTTIGNTYFDDFAIQFGESAGMVRTQFLQPIQY